MKKFAVKFLVILLLFVLALLLQSNRFFEVGEIAPNLILIGFLILALVLPRKENLKFIIFIGIALAALALFWFPFWFWGIVIAALLGVILSFLKNLLSGDAFIDFFISIVVFTILFYGIFWVFGSIFLWPAILIEIIYGLVLGEFVLLLVNRF